MDVTLLDYTGNHHANPADFAAGILLFMKSTRLEQSPDTFRDIMAKPYAEKAAELEKIAMSIRSSWEFVDYTFNVRGVTRAYTHQQVRTRIASYAQQAMRVADMSTFEALKPKTVAQDHDASAVWDKCMEFIAQTYRSLRVFDIPAQDARGVLPTNVLTNINMKFNLRTLADIVGKRENLRVQDEFADVVRGMKKCVLEVHPWAETFLNPPRLQTPTIDRILRRLLGDASPVDQPEINEALKELDRVKGIWG